MRADFILRERFPGLSRRQIAEAFESSWVTSAHATSSYRRPLKKSAKLELPEQLDATELSDRLEKLKTGAGDLPIRPISNGGDFVVVSKAAGIASVPLNLSDDRTVTAWARFHHPEVNTAFSEPQPELAPHRLDTYTAGLLIVCLTPESHARWRDAFSLHKVEKQYTAWVWGTPEKPEFDLRTSLLLVTGKARVLKAEEKDPFAAEFEEPGTSDKSWKVERSSSTHTASSRVKVLESHPDGYSKVLVTTFTGIRHQVRAQMAHAGFPLVGDRVYDEQIDSRPFSVAHHMLWASSLQTEEGTWTDAPPEDWRPVSNP